MDAKQHHKNPYTFGSRMQSIVCSPCQAQPSRSGLTMFVREGLGVVSHKEL
jgi:hypothetical protein